MPAQLPNCIPNPKTTTSPMSPYPGSSSHKPTLILTMTLGLIHPCILSAPEQVEEVLTFFWALCPPPPSPVPTEMAHPPGSAPLAYITQQHGGVLFFAKFYFNPRTLLHTKCHCRNNSRIQSLADKYYSGSKLVNHRIFFKASPSCVAWLGLLFLFLFFLNTVLKYKVLQQTLDLYQI